MITELLWIASVLVFWVIFTAAIIRHGSDGLNTYSADDEGDMVLVGMLAALIWPVALLAWIVRLLVRRVA